MAAPEIEIRVEGRAGRITLNRPEALNALTAGMIADIDAALRAWATDPDVSVLVIDGAGDKAFCSGGDIAELYAHGQARDFAFGARFWADEYRMNARMFEFPKPVVTFLQGYTMGGGVGVGCHGSHRIVGDTSRIAMPECSIGLVPDVGGSLILARAPGRLGEYLGLTAARMDAGAAILAGFADYYIPETGWPMLKAALIETGDPGAVDAAAAAPPDTDLARDLDEIDQLFRAETLRGILNALRHADTPLADKALTAIGRNSPLACAAAVELIHRVRSTPDNIRHALGLEYRFTARAMEHGDFLEGIRAAIIDRDGAPKWRHARAEDVTGGEVSHMLMPLGRDALAFEE